MAHPTQTYSTAMASQIREKLIRDEKRAVRRRRIAFAITPVLILAFIAGYAYLTRVYLPKARRARDFQRLLALDVRVGDTIVFGNDDWENTWCVLAVEGSQVLIVNEQCIDRRFFDDRDRGWDDCLLRSWLNYDYFEYGFNEDEQALICDRGPGGIFLLSHQELGQYFSCEKDRIAIYVASPTYWWLRTDGETPYGQTLQLFVFSNGEVDREGMPRGQSLGVRPAMWLDVGN